MTQQQATIDYRTYIRSDEWMLRRVAALERSIAGRYYRTPCCELCGRRGVAHKNPRNRLDSKDRRHRVDNSLGLEVHHITYRNLGREEPADLIVLCTDSLYLGNYDISSASTTNVGCHERCHLDPLFRAAVERVAGRRP